MRKFEGGPISRVLVAFVAAMAIAAGSVAFAQVAGTDTYTYDSYGRLLSVTYADGSSITYAYDPSGNRVTLVQTP